MSRLASSCSRLLACALLALPLAAQSNVLVIVADDVGVDMLASYGLGSDLPNTPNLDALAANGVLFRNVWSNPVCSPTRATILTGRYSFRNGLGYVVDPTWALPLTEFTLPEALETVNKEYKHGAFGKWHLGNSSVGGLASPNLAGFDWFSGTMGNLSVFGPFGYYGWFQTVNAIASPTFGYITTRTSRDALQWIQDQAQSGKPWFCYVAFHAAHAPFHAPPPYMHTVDLSTAGDPSVDPRPYYKAMIEAMDFEIGKLINGLASELDDTYVIFVGDNGTPSAVTVPPFDPQHAKGTIYQGGIHVPMIVTGPSVRTPGTECKALVTTADLFATAINVAVASAPQDQQQTSTPQQIVSGPQGLLSSVLVTVTTGTAPPSPYVSDSVSFLPYLEQPDLPTIRKLAYAERFQPNGFGPPSEEHRTVRGTRYKLTWNAPTQATPETSTPLPTQWQGGVVYGPQPVSRDAALSAGIEQLFDLAVDPFETENLLDNPTLTVDQQIAYGQLKAALQEIAGP